MSGHWLRKEEQCDAIRNLKRRNNLVVRRSDEIKCVTAKGDGLFRCFKCGNTWSSHNSSIRVDLSRARVFRLYKQRCQQCYSQWAVPHFTIKRFEVMIMNAIRIFENIKYGYRNNRPPPVRGNAQGPHKMEDCERCQELGRHC